MSAESNVNVFDGKKFHADAFVKSLVQECVGGTELQQRKHKIQQFSDQTSSLLKKHVYANYNQFIETAKEISHLESEMYQLSHVLIEQRNILLMLREDNLLDDPKNLVNEEHQNDVLTQEQKQNRKIIQAIKESVQGFNGNLDNKTFLHEGGVIELDSDNYRPICRVYLFLFNDLLLISKVKHDKKLEFILQYDASKIAVINIKDLDGVKNAINIITPDGTKIFQCISPITKNEWIDKFEVALKFNQNSNNNNNNTNNTNNKHKKGPAPQPPKTLLLQKQKSIIDTRSLTSIDTGATSPMTDTGSIFENWAPEWIISAPEEIQALIAQRHFEDAFSLIIKCNEYFVKDNSFFNANEIMDKIKELKINLSNVLLLELSNCQSRSLQAALRSSRRSLKLLGEMGKGRQACDSLLKVCSSAIRASQRQARRGNLEISEIFFCDLAQVATEFLRAFSGNTACISTLVVWCNTELQYFASQVIKHYLTKGSQLEVVAKFVDGIRKPCIKLTEIGLDLAYHMEGLLRNTLEQIIEESRYRLIDTIGRTEEIWQPYNLQSKTNLRILLKELDCVGIDMKSQVTGDTWINLTQSTVNFCRHFLSVTESCGLLAKNESLKNNVEILLKELFLAQYNIKPSPTVTVDLNFVSRNKSYLSEVLLVIAVKKFEQNCNGKSDLLTELLLQIKGPPKPKPRSIYKTDVL